MYQGYRLMHIGFLSPWSCPVSVSSLCVLSLWLFVFPVWSSEYIFSPAPSIYLFHPFVSSVSRVSMSVYVRSLCQVHVSYLALSVCITYCFILIVLCLMWVMFSCASCVLSVRFCSAVLWQVCPLCSNLLLCTYYLHLPRFFVASFLMVCEHLSICLPINLFLPSSVVVFVAWTWTLKTFAFILLNLITPLPYCITSTGTIKLTKRVVAISTKS